MQRRKHQVTGQRRTAGNFGSLGVPDLPDQDDVRVLAQNGAQSFRKGQLDVRIDLHLIEARIVVLDRILDGDDVDRRRLDPIQNGV